MVPEIVFEDDYLFAISKPYGIVVNDSETQKGKLTLQSWLLEKYPDIYGEVIAEFEPDIQIAGESNGKLYKNEFYNRSGVVHRLDKDTSGVIIVAKDPSTFLKLQALFKAREVKKEYFAVVFGIIKDLEVGDDITIDAPIARNPNSREKFAVVKDGKESVTIIQLIDTIPDFKGQSYSIVKCFPKSGRTHQIRVHLTALGHPVAGDIIYSGNKRSKKYRSAFPRQLLHAHKIIFKHPITENDLELEAPIPDDMSSVIDLMYGR